MSVSYGKIGLAALSLATLGLVALPGRASAQDTGSDTGNQTDPANKKIDLDLESTNLYYGLKLLFSQVKANFTIDESLKSLTVTAHLTQVPFRVALETLLKSTSTPLTYKVENGIYSVVPKVEEPDNTKPDATTTTDNGTPKENGYKFGILRPNNLSAVDIVQAFGGHIVNVGYNPQQTGGYGQGGLGGGMGGGLGGGMGGGMGGFGGGMGGMGGGMGGFGGGMGGIGGGMGGGGFGGGGRGGFGGGGGGGGRGL